MAAAWKVRAGEFYDAWIFYGLALVVAFLPIYNALTSLGLGLALFFFLTRLIFSAKRSSMIPPTPALALFVLFCVISTIFSNSPRDGAIGLRKLALYIFFFFSFTHICLDEKRRNFLFVVFLLTGAIVSMDGFYQIVTGSDWLVSRPLVANPQLGIHRVTASFLQAGALSIYLGVVVSIALSLTLFFFKGGGRAWAGLGVLLILSVMGLTLAPGAALGFLCMLIFVCVIKKIYWPIMVAVILFLALFFLLPGSLTKFPDGRLFKSLGERAQLWQVAMSLISQHPLIGGGLNTFGQRYAAIVKEGCPYYHLGTPYAHNMYIQLIAETGSLGFCSLLFFIVSLFRAGLRAYFHTEDPCKKTLLLGCLGGFIAFLAHGLLESSFQTSQGALLFWLLAGFIASFVYQNISQEVRKIIN